MYYNKEDSPMSIVTVLDHPMLQHKLTLLRKKEVQGCKR